jgi:hypothetical protein
MKTNTSPELLFWSCPGAHPGDKALDEAAHGDHSLENLPLGEKGRYYRARLRVPSAGTLVLNLESPRPVRVTALGERIVDEPLWWRSFQRRVQSAAVFPVFGGELILDIEVGERPHPPAFVEEECPSRNREKVRAALATRFPDRLSLKLVLEEQAEVPPVAFRFLPGQFVREGWRWQEVVVRRLRGMDAAPSTEGQRLSELTETAIILGSEQLPGRYHDGSTPEDLRAGIRRLYVAVAPAHKPEPLREIGVAETRPEPELEVAGTTGLIIGSGETLTLSMPVFEALGRMAPQHRVGTVSWPEWDELQAKLPKPILPPDSPHLERLYNEAWKMLLRLVVTPRMESGLPGSFIRTGTNFPRHTFIWDSSFTAIAARYGWRYMPATANLDFHYSRQHDGGYIHRETDFVDGTPALFEPDFSVNPPLLAVAEWELFLLCGDVGRLRAVYPALSAHYRWIEQHRRLPDGTYWTTGLANGLDNSPSLGEGYPDLTAQMIQNAEILASMARHLKLLEEAEGWENRRQTVAAALNSKLWSESMQFYSTSLADGGHNPNKVVTGFWPLWAGVVPNDRVEALARHAQDPKSFGRHHPLPSLAADSPHYESLGSYWRGSTWAPTNYAAIRGFHRAGRYELARTLARKHLDCMAEVLDKTGFIWENYLADSSAPGGWSAPDYCWSALGPIALLFETVIGIQPDAPHCALDWTPEPGQRVGVQRYPLGPATVSLRQTPRFDGDRIEVETDFPITLRLHRNRRIQICDVAPGSSVFRWNID